MNLKTFYHGSATQIELVANRTMYFASTADVAVQYAEGQHELQQSGKGYIYSIEIDMDSLAVNEDFEEFDSSGYQVREGEFGEFNPESGYAWLANVPSIALVQTIDIAVEN